MKKLKFYSIILLIFISCKANKLSDLKIINLKGKVKSFKNTQSNNDNSPHSKLVDFEYCFDKNGMITIENEFIDNELTNKLVYDYDSKMRLVGIDYYSKNNQLKIRKKIENILNENDELIERKEILIGENLAPFLTHIFYSEFKINKKIEYLNNDIYQKTQYKYNEKGQEIEQVLIKSNQYPIYKIFSTYNENGDIETSISKDENGKVIEIDNFKYLEFDNYNNWTKLEISRLDSIYTQIERKITYY